MASKPKLYWLVPATVTGALVPFVVMGYRLYRHRLGANPIATALNQVGLLALIFLVASLSCTPFKVLFNWNWPLRVRRTLGLCGFFAALLHFSIYFALDQRLELGPVLKDITKRPFIAIGFSALVLLVPLAWTSTRGAVARMGFVRWQRLHRLAYAIGVLGVVHFYLRVKANHAQPIIYGLIVALGFALRVLAKLKRSRDLRLRAGIRAQRPEST